MLEQQTFMLMSTFGAFTMNISEHSCYTLSFINLFVESIEQNLVTIQAQQIMTNDLRNKIGQFIQHFITAVPETKLLGTWLSGIKDGETFLILPKKLAENELKIAKQELLKLNLPSYAENQASVVDLMNSIEKNYCIKIFNEQTQPIGKINKEERKCIFCEATGKENFRKKAHAISESLGNKHIIQNEECDKCNELFGSSVEDDFAKYLEFFRSMFKIQGKHGIPESENGSFMHEKGKFQFQASIKKEDKDSLQLSVESSSQIVPQNLYKALAKYAISLIGARGDDFIDTISWLKGGCYEKSDLPKIAISFQKGLDKEFPWAITYSRKTNERNLPKYILELHVRSFVFVAIVPYVTGEKCNFTLEKDYKFFWQNFKMYAETTGWIFESWQDDTPQKFENVITITKSFPTIKAESFNRFP